MYVLCHTEPSIEQLLIEIPDHLDECNTCPPDKHIEHILERVHGVRLTRLCVTLSDMATTLYKNNLCGHQITRILIFEGCERGTNFILYSCILKIYHQSAFRNPKS